GMLGGYCFDILSKVTGKKYAVSSVRVKNSVLLRSLTPRKCILLVLLRHTPYLRDWIVHCNMSLFMQSKMTLHSFPSNAAMFVMKYRMPYLGILMHSIPSNLNTHIADEV
ncbi:UDP-N-acetylglucosamine 4-epimerase, partial [Salmonella enterica subsp. enterica serovar Gaminara str. ATCC BAA-711]